MKPGQLLALTFLMIAVSVSGCICCCNWPAPKPAPIDSIIGHWECFEYEGHVSLDFFPNGTMYFYEENLNGQGAGSSGTWSKINNSHYKVEFGQYIHDDIVLNNDKTGLYIGVQKVYFVKK